MGLQGLGSARQLGGVGFVAVVQVVGARLGIRSPFAIVGNQLGRAIAVPAGLVISPQRRIIFVFCGFQTPVESM
jgi:hypothetical protein